MTFYRQCMLRKESTTEIAWIPEEFAKQGKVLRIKDDDGWLVCSVGNRKSGEYLAAHERDYLGHRSRTDI